ncbi:Rv2253/PknI dimerization domain-containing protein [Mycolicibacterium palauense]|uniref:hypothetical protein n=1 Tax=Mycolicibacterium palauense TaxID=2034511 RepID=UPI000BFEE90F|nr:hypothetical protein [Mycolicibacterium palauense]
MADNRGDDAPIGDDAPTGLAATELGAAIDETEAVTAWSLADDDEPIQKRRLSARQITTLALAGSLVIVVSVAVFAGYTMGSGSERNAPPAAVGTVTESFGAPAVSAVEPLDGVYRIDYSGEVLQNGTAAPFETEAASSYWAFRTNCSPGGGCSAVGVGLDDSQAPRTPEVTTTLRFDDDAWQEVPVTSPVDRRECLLPDGRIGPGTDIESSASRLEPLPGGALKGSRAATVLTNSCGFAGTVLEEQVSVERVGATPTDIDIPDAAPAAPPPAQGASSAAKMDGLFTIQFNNDQQTVNGRPAAKTFPNATELWAFRSACTADGCAAVGAQVFDQNPQQNTGIVTVLHLEEGQWQSSKTLQPPGQCNTGAPGADVMGLEWSVVRQPDGVLRGVATGTILTDQCGHEGYVYKSPFVGVRTGDVPSRVVIADPGVFVGN